MALGIALTVGAYASLWVAGVQRFNRASGWFEYWRICTAAQAKGYNTPPLSAATATVARLVEVNIGSGTIVRDDVRFERFVDLDRQAANGPAIITVFGNELLQIDAADGRTITRLSEMPKRRPTDDDAQGKLLEIADDLAYTVWLDSDARKTDLIATSLENGESRVLLTFDAEVGAWSSGEEWVTAQQVFRIAGSSAIRFAVFPSELLLGQSRGESASQVFIYKIDADGTQPVTITAHFMWGSPPAFSSDGARMYAAVSEDPFGAKIGAWDLETGAFLGQLADDGSVAASGGPVVYDSNTRWLFAVGHDRDMTPQSPEEILVLDTRRNQCRGCLAVPGGPHFNGWADRLLLSPDGRTLAAIFHQYRGGAAAYKLFLYDLSRLPNPAPTLQSPP